MSGEISSQDIYTSDMAIEAPARSSSNESGNVPSLAAPAGRDRTLSMSKNPPPSETTAVKMSLQSFANDSPSANRKAAGTFRRDSSAGRDSPKASPSVGKKDGAKIAGSMEKSGTMRFSFKKQNWKETVDMNSPRSLAIASLEQKASQKATVGLIGRDFSTLSNREKVIKELCTTELSYCKNLQQVVKVCQPMAEGQKVFKPDVEKEIFGNITEVYDCNVAFLGQLYKLADEWNDASSLLGDVMVNALDTFKPYAAYLSEYGAALKRLEELEGKSAVKKYIDASQEECGGLPVTSLLVTPVQRIPRYELLLKEIIKHTPEGHPDLENLKKALVSVKKYADDMNKAVRLAENRKEFQRLTGIIEHLNQIKSPLLWSDDKLKIIGVSETDACSWMILFADRVVFVKSPVEGNSLFTILHEVPLHTAWAKKHKETTFFLSAPDRSIVIETEIAQSTTQWLERLDAALAEELVAGSFADPDIAGTRRFAFKFTPLKGGQSIYQGQWRDAKPHGHGKYKYQTKASYEGAFEMGKRVGAGKISYPSGEWYEGAWAEDLPCGVGKMLSMGSEYEGDFSNGLPHGTGKAKYPDGSAYSGAFAYGLYEGVGEFTDSCGSKYVGEWKGGLREGQGKLLCNGAEYEGAFAKDKFNGEGRLVYQNGNVYVGPFLDGVPSGKGLLTTFNGFTYDGLFKEGFYNGVGTLKGPAGLIYEGSFKDGLRDGKGVQTFENGSTYDGEWSRNLRHGHGKFTYGSFQYDGSWENDVFSGRGKVTSDGKLVYDGQWNGGRKNGKGIHMYPDGTKYTGSFVNDRREGVGVLESGGWKYVGNWKSGRRSGQGQLTHAVYKFDGTWVDDRRTGPGKEKFVDLCITFEGDYENDARLKGKVVIEPPGKTPIAWEVDYAATKQLPMLLRLPPPMAGPQWLSLDI